MQPFFAKWWQDFPELLERPLFKELGDFYPETARRIKETLQSTRGPWRPGRWETLQRVLRNVMAEKLCQIVSSRDRDSLLRMEAAEFLGQLGHLDPLGEEAADALAVALRDEDMLIRIAACDALAAGAPPMPKAIATLSAALHDTKEPVQRAAARALKKIQRHNTGGAAQE